ncbi:MAG TPA: ribonuclease P protein component [Candidatus Paceibacterota bacterium]
MKAKDFRKVHGQRQGFREDGLLLKVGAQKSSASRLGIVVSKKVEKLAVRRNRIRRVLREASREEMGLVGGGRDLVLIVLPGFDLSSFQETQKRLRALLRKASLAK